VTTHIYAEMSKFDFQVSVNKNGLVEGVGIYYKLDDSVTSYDITTLTSDIFRNNKVPD
jgi:hypothetical protein